MANNLKPNFNQVGETLEQSEEGGLGNFGQQYFTFLNFFNYIVPSSSSMYLTAKQYRQSMKKQIMDEFHEDIDEEKLKNQQMENKLKKRMMKDQLKEQDRK